MIEFECDRCERRIGVEPAAAGTKVDCPHCGDVNRVPSAGSARGETEPIADDRASAAGYPPDSGPEQEVLIVRPSLWRGKPLSVSLLAVSPVVIGVLVGVVATPVGGGIALGASALVFWGVLGVWWLNVHVGHSLRITNKRTVEHVGLLSRSTNEVLHDHVRNIQVEQSFVERLLGIGRVGISSAGQDGIEIEIHDLPGPDRVREVIDLYRPL